MKNKRDLLLVLVGLVIFAGASLLVTTKYLETKQANDGTLAADTTINANVNAGTLSISAPGTASMSAIDLDAMDDSGGTSTGTISGIKVKDHRGTSPGWSATMTCTNFTDGGSNSIPVTDLTVTPDTPSAVGNSSLTGVTAGTAHTYTGTSDPATLMSATTGNGRGRFNQDVDLSLLIDVTTVPASYSATCTETVS